MGFRFRKRIKLGNLLHLNIGKTGITSLSIGKKGCTFNVNSKGVKTTLGLPGTGVSYSTKRYNSSDKDIPKNINNIQNVEYAHQNDHAETNKLFSFILLPVLFTLLVTIPVFILLAKAMVSRY